MGEQNRLKAFLDGAWVEDSVFALRPDYRVMLLAVGGIVPGPSDAASDALLKQAEAFGARLVASSPIEEIPQVASWRDAYRSFGAKPQRTRNSLEALLRRTPTGLPRVNRLTDVYNAISVLHLLPVGGEDAARYTSSPYLVRAVGDEPFDTKENGVVVVEHPEPGEVIWRDNEGVTCRRWNWRQGVRTQLQEETTSAIFILDAMDPMATEALLAATADLVEHSKGLGPNVSVYERLIEKGPLKQDR